jgi:hypothetical protein
MLKMRRRGPTNWCHLCKGSSLVTVDIHFDDFDANNRGSPAQKTRIRYIRICAGCADRIGAVARGAGKSTFLAPGTTSIDSPLKDTSTSAPSLPRKS